MAREAEDGSVGLVATELGDAFPAVVPGVALVTRKKQLRFSYKLLSPFSFKITVKLHRYCYIKFTLTFCHRDSSFPAS